MRNETHPRIITMAAQGSALTPSTAAGREQVNTQRGSEPSRVQSKCSIIVCYYSRYCCLRASEGQQRRADTTGRYHRIFFNLFTIDMRGGQVHVAASCALSDVSSIPGLHPLKARSTFSSSCDKNASRHCQLSHGSPPSIMH